LVVLHVDEILPGARTAFAPDEPSPALRIAAQVAELRAAGVRVVEPDASTPAGGVAQTIAEVAEERRADGIVVGSPGRAPRSGLLLGSVVQRLLRIAHRPVLVVPAPPD